LRFIDSIKTVVGAVEPFIIGAILASFGLSVRAGAQNPRAGVCDIPAATDSSQSPNEAWSFGVWFAGGTHQPIKTRVGHKEDRALYLVGISASRPLKRWRMGDLRFTPTLVPAILATANREYRTVPYPLGGVTSVPYKRSSIGAGLLPIAVEARALLSDRFGLIVGGGGGAAYFDRRIPDPGETRFNFLADGHTGIYLRSAVGTTTVGFRLQHISNGDTGRVNPGLDSRMLFVAFSL
jgi:hypothetical protein